MTRSNKKGLKSLGPMRAVGKEVRDNRNVLHCRYCPTSNRPELLNLLSHKLGSNIQLNCSLCQFVLYEYRKTDIINVRPIS